MTGYLLDTSTLSILGDPRRPRYPALRRWYEDTPDQALFVSTIALGELARGVEGLPEGRNRRRHEHQLHHIVIPAFADRVLAFDLECALRWGVLMGEGRRAGRMPDNDDAKIAAVAAVNGLTIVTDNLRHFEPLGVPCLNPAD